MGVLFHLPVGLDLMYWTSHSPLPKMILFINNDWKPAQLSWNCILGQTELNLIDVSDTKLQRSNLPPIIVARWCCTSWEWSHKKANKQASNHPESTETTTIVCAWIEKRGEERDGIRIDSTVHSSQIFALNKTAAIRCLLQEISLATLQFYIHQIKTKFCYVGLKLTQVKLDWILTR